MKTNNLVSNLVFSVESLRDLFNSRMAQSCNFNSLIDILSYSFVSGDLIVRSLIHSSFSNETGGDVGDNESLEFVGDAVIQLAVTSILINRYSDFSEGNLSKFRSALVNRDALAELGHCVNLKSVLLVGEGIKKMGIADSLVANSFEAIIGAIYMDGGFNAAETSFKFVLDFFKKRYGEDFINISRLHEFDAKSRLQEECQLRFGELPEYVVENDDGPRFRVDLHIKGKKVLSKEGDNKKRVQQELAKELVKDKFSKLSEITKGENYVN